MILNKEIQPVRLFCGCSRRVNPRPNIIKWYTNAITHIIKWHIIHIPSYKLCTNLINFKKPILKPIIKIIYKIQSPGRKYGASWVDKD